MLVIPRSAPVVLFVFKVITSLAVVAESVVPERDKYPITPEVGAVVVRVPFPLDV